MKEFFAKYGKLAFILIACVGIGFLAFKFLPGLLEKKDADIAPEATGPVALKVAPIVYKVLDRVDQVPGEIYAYQDVAIYPKVSGFIEWIGVDRGSTVKKGQLMVGLIAPEMVAQRNEAAAAIQDVKSQLHEAQSQLASVKSQLSEAKAKLAGDNDTYERTKKASQTPGVVAPNTVIVLENIVEADKDRITSLADQVVAFQNKVQSLIESVQVAQRSFENYKDLEDYLTIAAPFDGYITERNMHVGSFCGPRGKEAYPPIVRIQQLNNLRIVAPVPEVDTAGVQPGQKVEFTVSTHPGRRFVGSVARLGNYLDQRTRTMPVELNYWNTKNLDVLPGMFCEIYWPSKRKYSTLFAPADAVVTESTLKTFVCKVNEKNEVEWVAVKRGQMMGNYVEVFGDIKEGDLVAIKGSDELRQGTAVKPETVETSELEGERPKRPAYPAHHGS